MTHESDHDPGRSGGKNETFENLLYDYIDRLNCGEILDKEQIRADQPDFADALLDQLQVFEGIGAAFESNAPLGTLGDYTLRRQIGRGGMGVVYEAWQGSMDRVVALKVLPAGVAADQKACARFMREAQTAGQLNHQNVVSVHSTGIEEGTPWYSMEYVDGETLAQILSRLKDAEPETETPFGKKDCAGYFEQLARAFADVADGLQHAHSKSVTHRDMKPSNLILDHDGRLRILDFGLARLEGQESLTLSGDVMGTPLYMSPEQARRKKIPVDHRTDVYSLGATMYEAICGRPPFRGKDHADTLSQIIEQDPVEPRKVNPRVPKDLETIVLKCLRKESGNRYGTAEALGQDLRRFVRGDAVEARPQTAIERVARWTRRRAAVIGLVSFTFLLIFVGGWVTTVLVWKAKVATDRALEEVRVHADLRTLNYLREHAERLWPCVPTKVSAMEAWLESAKKLEARLEERQRSLQALRQWSLPYDDEQKQLDRESHPRAGELTNLKKERESLITKAKTIEASEAGEPPTAIDFGPDPRKKRISYYFRQAFEFKGSRESAVLVLRLEVDDGAIVYLNGQEVWRANMPEGVVTADTVATEFIDGPARHHGDLPAEHLRLGWNLVAVEVHQANVGSSDVYFDLELLTSGESLIATCSPWRYSDESHDPGNEWRDLDYDDSAWPLGIAPLGYGFKEGLGRAVELQAQADDLEVRIEEVRGANQERRTWRFSSIELQLRHDALTELVQGLKRVQEPNAGLLSDMRQRRAIARTIYRRSVEDRKQVWRKAISSIRDRAECPQYGGFDLPPQLGLVPIGQDSDSHLQTGDVPQRDETGRIVVTETTGLVFVLIPGGRFIMGAEKTSERSPLGSPNRDPFASHEEGPIHAVEIEPFFLSKFEMTQGQWLRFTGENPSLYGNAYHTGPHGAPVFLRHPVERVSWNDCDRVLRCLGLLLPTEAQWEYSARAGTTTVASTGDEVESIRGAANIADRSCRKYEGPTAHGYEEWLDDGWVYHAPVGSLRANPFGLHDTMGNVAEWCRDHYGQYSQDFATGDGERRAPSGSTHRIYRGGSWSSTANPIRSANREWGIPALEGGWLGVRPSSSVKR